MGRCLPTSKASPGHASVCLLLCCKESSPCPTSLPLIMQYSSVSFPLLPADMWGSGGSSSHTSLQHLNAQQHIYRRQKLRALGKAQTSRASLICLGIAGSSAGKGTDLGSFTPHLCEAKGMGFPGGCQHVRFILELTHSKGRALQLCHEKTLLKPGSSFCLGSPSRSGNTVFSLLVCSCALLQQG